MRPKRNCFRCKKLVNTKNLYKKGGEEYCGLCIKKFRKIINLKCIDPRKPPKEYLPKERQSKEKPITPKIPGVKRIRSFRGSPYQHLYLTKIEKDVLWKKYVSNGLTSEQVRLRLSKGVKYLEGLVFKMKNKGVEEKEISKKFKEEFAKLVESSR